MSAVPRAVRMAAVAVAAVVSVASLLAHTHKTVEYECLDGRSLWEQEGLLVEVAAAHPTGAGAEAYVADGFEVRFLVRNRRSGQVTVTTEKADLVADGRQTWTSRTPVSAGLRPGETSEFRLRFEGGVRREDLWSRYELVLGEAVLEDGRRVRIVTTVKLR